MYFLVNLDFSRLGSFPWKSDFITRNEAQEQHSLLDTIFNYIFLGPLGKHLYLSLQNPLHGRHVVGFLDFAIDMLLEVQDKRPS